MKKYFLKKNKKEKDELPTFAEISIEGNVLTGRHGLHGFAGRTRTTEMESAGKAKAEYEMGVKRLISQGYKESSPPKPGTHPPETVYLENRESGQFFEISEESNTLRIRRGQVGKPCLVFHSNHAHEGDETAAREQLERLLIEWKGKGFARSEPSSPIIPGSEAKEVFPCDIEDGSAHAQIFPLFNTHNFDQLRASQAAILHFPDGLQYEGDLDFEMLADTELSIGVIIEGDMRVEGVLSQLTDDYPGAILVTGNIYAHSLGHENSHMRVLGNVEVQNIVYGRYNDGELVVCGDMSGSILVSCDHSMWTEGEYHIAHYDPMEPIDKVFLPDLIDDEGKLDEERLVDYMMRRISPLK